MARLPLLCSATIGREAQSGVLFQALSAATHGTGSVLFVGGDAGVGKSRLVRELKQEAIARRVRAVEGRCSSTESSVPYAPFMDALRFRLTRGEGEAASRVLGPLAGLLAPLFPELKPGPDSPALEHTDRPFEPIFAVLERLASAEPMLLILEDVHWADQTSLEILHHLARRVAPLRLMVVATYRSDELHAAHPLRRLLATLLRERAAVHVALEPLGREETREMLRCLLHVDPTESFVSAIWRRTEGNPFFVEVLVTALAADEAHLDADPTSALEAVQLPATVRDAVLARVHALGPRALEVLSVAAIAGRRVEFDVLRETLGYSELELVEVVEQLVAHQLLREERAGEEYYAFPHALMQEALYDTVISRRRRILHRRVAEVLEARAGRRSPTHFDALAYHYRLGGDHERAHAYSRQAGEEAARLHAWDDAVAHYERALAALESTGDDGTRTAELLERLTDVAWRRSSGDDSRQYAEDALRLRRALGQHESAAGLLRRLADQTLDRDNDATSAERFLVEALALLDAQPRSPELAPVYDDLARIAAARGDLDRAESLLERALRHAGDVHTTEEVLALVSLGEIALRRGDRVAGLARLDVGFEVLRDSGLPAPRAARAISAALRALLMAQEYPRALQWSDAGARLAREQGLVGLDSLFDAYAAAVEAITGERDPLPELAAAVTALRNAERPQLREALHVLGFVQRIRGDLAAARVAFEEAGRLGDRGVPVEIALVDLAEGDAARAAGVLEQEIMTSAPGDHLLRLHLLPHAVRALVQAGEVPRARALLQALLPHASDDSPEVRLTRAVLAEAGGRRKEAAAAYASAADGWAARGNVAEATRARAALAELLLAHPDSVAAGRARGRTLLDDSATSTFAAERARVRRALRRAGVRVRPGSPSPSRTATLLTSREEMVLREVAKGRTNREIADALGIAEKTVSVHVSHILSKLGCRTRTQAARFVPTSS